MRGQGEQPTQTQQRRTGRGFRDRRSQQRGRVQPASSNETRSHTGVFSTVGAEPRSSWTIPGATVIPNPSVDPSARSWVDPDAVPGVLGPPQANPTSHGDDDLPGLADPVDDNVGPDHQSSSQQAHLGTAEPSSAPPARSSGLATVAIGKPIASVPLDVPAAAPPARVESAFRQGQTGLVDLSRDPRARLVGALVVVVLLVLLVGRIGDLSSPVGEVGEALANWVALGPG